MASIAAHRRAYLIAVAGPPISYQRLSAPAVVAFEDLGMEAIYEFDVKDMPVTVAVAADGENVHTSGPSYWRQRLALNR